MQDGAAASPPDLPSPLDGGEPPPPELEQAPESQGLHEAVSTCVGIGLIMGFAYIGIHLS